MKKLLITVLTIMTCGAAYALPVGNPSEASLLHDGLFWEGHCGADPCDPCLTWCDAFSLRVGFYGDYVFNRHMRIHHPNGGNSHQLETFQIFTNAGYLALNLWDRFDVFSSLGASNMFLQGNINTFVGTTSTARAEFATDSSFSWSVGGRGTLWECGCTALGIEGQYFSTRPRVSRFTFAATDSIYPNDPYINLNYWEWQVGAGISHRINMFVPYVAVKYARANTEFRPESASLVLLDTTLEDTIALSNSDLRSKKHWGYAVGVSLVDCEKAALTVEGRFADEKAVYVNGQIRF